MPRQLTFDLPVKQALGRDDFFVSPANRLAVAALENWRQWPQGKLVLVGPRGSGKTHLAHVWAAETGAQILNASEVTEADAAALGPEPKIVVEDVDRIAGSASCQRALFHLHNATLAAGGRLLITGATAPMRWDIALADLASRLQGTSVIELDAPDDALLSAVLLKLFADRQLAVPPSLIPYLLRRMDRSFAEARNLVDALDRRALAEGRPITQTLAAAVLDNHDPDAR